MPAAERIKGRLVEIKSREVEGLGRVAVGVVRQGSSHETGMLFEAAARDPIEAGVRLEAEIEAYFD